MEHLYAALLVNESGGELNERTLTSVLDAAGCDVSESRTKALVAALDGVDVDGAGSGVPEGAVDGSAGLVGAADDGPRGEDPADGGDSPDGDRHR